MEAIESALGLKLIHVPFKGSGESVGALRAQRNPLPDVRPPRGLLRGFVDHRPDESLEALAQRRQSPSEQLATSNAVADSNALADVRCTFRRKIAGITRYFEIKSNYRLASIRRRAASSSGNIFNNALRSGSSTGPDVLTEATIVPARSRIGTAIVRTPSSTS